MIDYTKNDYIKFGAYTNVVLERTKGLSAPEGLVIHDTICDLVRKVALAHPEWTLVGQDAYGYSPCRVSDFRVYEGDEEVGRFYADRYSHGESRITIDNKRIRSQRVKRGGMATSDMKKAFKAIERNFSSKTLTERVVEASEAVRDSIQNNTWRKTRVFNNLMERIQYPLAAYLVEHMDEIAPVLIAKGAPAEAFVDLPAARETAAAMKQMEPAKGTTIITHGTSYIVMDQNAGTNAVVRQAHELSNDMRGKLGILKTCDVMEYPDPIENVGVRINANTFFILN